VADSAVIIDGVSKRFRLYRERNQSLKAALMRGKRASYEEFWALRDVSLDIPTGSTFGLIGENGSGKSTLLKCIARILRPEAGSIRTNGSVAALLELGSGFHPELSGRENVYLNGSILARAKPRSSASSTRSSISPASKRSSINRLRTTHLACTFGSDSRWRVQRLVHDCLVGVLDEHPGQDVVHERCMAKFADFRRAGKTVVIVSHAMGSLRTLCDHAACLGHGQLIEVGDATNVVDTYIDEGHAERKELADGSSRWGSGEVQLTKLQVLDRAGESTTRVQTKDKITIRMHFAAKTPVYKPVFGLAIETIAGVYACISQ
jgi:ABC-2 type transport system ATP-binding protein